MLYNIGGSGIYDRGDQEVTFSLFLCKAQPAVYIRIAKPPRVTLAEVTFSLFLCKAQPAVYIRIAKPSRPGGETIRVGELSGLGR